MINSIPSFPGGYGLNWTLPACLPNAAANALATGGGLFGSGTEIIKPYCGGDNTPAKDLLSLHPDVSRMLIIWFANRFASWSPSIHKSNSCPLYCLSPSITGPESVVSRGAVRRRASSAWRSADSAFCSVSASRFCQCVSLFVVNSAILLPAIMLADVHIRAIRPKIAMQICMLKLNLTTLSKEDHHANMRLPPLFFCSFGDGLCSLRIWVQSRNKIFFKKIQEE